MNGWVLVLAVAALTLLQRLALHHWGLKGLRYMRSFSRETAFEGEEAELVEVIRNDRPLFVPWLLREIAAVRPRALVTLGNVPLKALMGPKATVGDLHGRWHTAQNGLPLYALYHPAAIIYRRELRAVYEHDVLALRDSMTFETSK